MSKIVVRPVLYLNLLVGVGVLLLAIGFSPSAQAATGVRKAPKPLQITLAGYSVAGSSAAMGEAIGEVIKRLVPGSAFTYEPGQSGANEVTVATGKVELGLAHTYNVKAAMEGKRLDKKVFPNLRAVAYLQDTYATWVFRKDAGITSLEQIKEKKFPLIAGVNTKNSAMEALARIGLEAYGISYADVEKWGGKIHYLPSNPTFDLMRNKNAHAFLGSASPPYAGFNELSINVDLMWPPMNDEAIQYVAKTMGGGKKVIVKKEWYPKFMTKDSQTVGIPHLLITRAETPEDLIYWVTKALYDNLDYLHKASPTLFPMTKETMARDRGTLPLHPGAEKFYREVGAL